METSAQLAHRLTSAGIQFLVFFGKNQEKGRELEPAHLLLPLPPSFLLSFSAGTQREKKLNGDRLVFRGLFNEEGRKEGKLWFDVNLSISEKHRERYNYFIFFSRASAKAKKEETEAKSTYLDPKLGIESRRRCRRRKRL